MSSVPESPGLQEKQHVFYHPDNTGKHWALTWPQYPSCLFGFTDWREMSLAAELGEEGKAVHWKRQEGVNTQSTSKTIKVTMQDSDGIFRGKMFVFYLTPLTMFTSSHPWQAAKHLHLHSAPKQSICISIFELNISGVCRA